MISCMISYHIKDLTGSSPRLFHFKKEVLRRNLRSFRYAHLHAIFTFSNEGVISYYHSKLLENPSVTVGGFIIPHLILTPLP